jgi:radical SAM superfamily enzyme YgiQ (UPF0313 family)
LKQDLEERAFASDIFVTGHAEESFVEILEQVRVLKQLTDGGDGTRGGSTRHPMVMCGQSSSVTLPPTFENLDLYDTPLTLPAQSTLGCAYYGRCTTFCTYPSIEDKPQKLDLTNAVGSVVKTAQRLGASVSLKDSLATATRLSEIGSRVRTTSAINRSHDSSQQQGGGGTNNIKWSACTKLSHQLDRSRLSQLTNDGLATLEVGLESLLPKTQRRIDKVQLPSLWEDFLSTNAASLSNSAENQLSLVVNYMTGFPWEDPVEAESQRLEVESMLHRQLGRDRGRMEME